MFHNCTRNLRQWTNQIIYQYELESRRQYLFYFKFLICFCSIIHWSNSRIRALSILLYSSTITSDAQSKATKKSFEELFFSLALTRSFEELISRCQKLFEKFIISFWKSFEKYIIFLLIWNSFEYEILASMIRNFSKNLWFHYDLTFALLLESHRNDLKKHYNRDFRIWQIRIDRNVCKNRRKTSNWRLFRNFFSMISSSNRLSCLLKFRWYYDLW